MQCLGPHLFYSKASQLLFSYNGNNLYLLLATEPVVQRLGPINQRDTVHELQMLCRKILALGNHCHWC